MDSDFSLRGRAIFIIIIAVLVGILLYSVLTMPKDEPPVLHEYDFTSSEQLNDGFLLISEWGEYKHNPSLVSLRDGVLVMDSSRGDSPQYILTAPIDVSPGMVVTIERKVRISRGDNIFAGGLALFQTEDMDIIPPPVDQGKWYDSMGDGVCLVEYSYDLKHQETRPGKDIFRFLGADWAENKNFELIPPVYDEWIEEKLVFDMRVNKMTYMIGDKKYSLNSYRPDKPAFRLLMHAYGIGKGNKIEIENLKIEIEDKSFRK